MDLPPLWEQAYRRKAPEGADPLPERRLARLLAAFIGAGLVFLVLPGTVLGVWNLLRISSRQAVPPVWIQAHGHAQLFGWVGTFIIGIALYTVPKFRGAMPRSLAVGWSMFVLWTAAVAVRWGTAVWNRGWRVAWPASGLAELLVAVLLIWQCSARGRGSRKTELWNVLVFAGLAGLAATLAVQVADVWSLAAPLLPPGRNHLLLNMALWCFCFPLVWGFASRFLPVFLGLAPTRKRAAYVGLALVPPGLWRPEFLLGAVALACWSLRIFHPAVRTPKVIGVDARYPFFARLAFAWLVLSAALAPWNSPGMTGASRHAFTVGFLATLIFAIGPRILPSFLNSRELWSKRLMLMALAALTAGCTLRVAAEPPAYAGLAPAAWNVLPVSAILELTAVVLFAINLGATLLSPMPAWMVTRTVHENVTLYWYVTAYPQTRRLLAGAGLKTLARVRQVPRALTLREAAEADGVAWQPLVALLRDYFTRRMARVLREKSC